MDTERSRRFRLWLGILSLATPVVGLPVIYVTGDQLYAQIEPDMGLLFSAPSLFSGPQAS